jgi:hypothetical protein
MLKTVPAAELSQNKDKIPSGKIKTSFRYFFNIYIIS